MYILKRDRVLLAGEIILYVASKPIKPTCAN